MIQSLKINNYKTIKELVLADCRRINVLIGKPNAGKSNIIEALTLPNISYYLRQNIGLERNNLEIIDVKKLFRADHARDLFYQGDINNDIEISFAGSYPDVKLSYLKNESESDAKNIFRILSVNGGFMDFDRDFNRENNSGGFGYAIKPFIFKNYVQFQNIENHLYLTAPFGNNLGEVLYYHLDLLELAADFLKDTNSNIVIDEKAFILKNQIQIKKKVIRSLAYESLADTFRRILFYTVAIRNAFDPVIVLEEPEAHAYPPYISFLADELIAQTQKQFFVVTHSPYLLNNLIENTPKEDLSVFVCGFDSAQKQTITKRLTNDDLSEFLDYGVDIFLRIDKYLDNHAEYSV